MTGASLVNYGLCSFARRQHALISESRAAILRIQRIWKEARISFCPGRGNRTSSIVPRYSGVADMAGVPGYNFVRDMN